MRATAAALLTFLLSILPASANPSTDRGVRGRIQHIVVVMMENRSFDHLLGWHPTADGIQAGLQYTDESHTAFTHALAPDYMGCGFNDPDHSFAGSRTSYDDGAMDGFLRAGDNDEYAIGYYVEEDRPFLSALARNYTTMIDTSRRSSPRPSPTASSFTPPRPTGSGTRTTCPRCRPSGTGSRTPA